MAKVSFHIPISEKQIERSRTHAAPEPIVEPLKEMMKARALAAPKLKIIDPTKKVRKARTKKVKPVFAGYAMPKPANAAGARDESMFARGTYVYGDGDVILPYRPGSLDFLKWPSVGNSC